MSLVYIIKSLVGQKKIRERERDGKECGMNTECGGLQLIPPLPAPSLFYDIFWTIIITCSLSR